MHKNATSVTRSVLQNLKKVLPVITGLIMPALRLLSPAEGGYRFGVVRPAVRPSVRPDVRPSVTNLLGLFLKDYILQI